MLILDGVRFTEWRAAHSGVMRVAGEHLATVLCAAVLVLLWIAIGRATRTRLTRSDYAAALDRGAALAIDAIVGASLLAVAVLLLGAVGAVSEWSVVVVALVALGIVRQSFAASARELWSAVLRAPRAAQILGAVGLIVALIPALTPPMEWDTLAYHLRLSIGALETGHFGAPVDARAYATLIGVAHLATLPLIALGLMEGAAVVHVLLLPIVIAGTVAFARRMLPESSSAVVTAMIVGCPALLLVAWSGRIDVVLTLAALAAHLAVVHAIDSRGNGAIAVAALAMGATVGVKSIGAAYVVALIPLVIVGRPLPAALVMRGVLLTLVA